MTIDGGIVDCSTSPDTGFALGGGDPFAVLNLALTPTGGHWEEVDCLAFDDGCAIPIVDWIPDYGNSLSLLGGIPENPNPGASDPCAGIGQGQVGYVNGHLMGTLAARFRFDAKGILSGVAIPNASTGGKPTNLGGLLGQIRITTNLPTTMGIAWVNGLLPGSFAFEASNPVTFDAGSYAFATISSLTFDGSFHVINGSAFGTPGTSGALENYLNSNGSAVISAADFANNLARSNKKCSDIFKK